MPEDTLMLAGPVKFASERERPEAVIGAGPAMDPADTKIAEPDAEPFPALYAVIPE